MQPHPVKSEAKKQKYKMWCHGDQGRFFLWSIGPHVTKFAIFGFHRLANAPTGLIFWSFFLVSDYMGSERISGHVVPKSTIRAGHRIKVSDTENPISVPFASKLLTEIGLVSTEKNS